jgi:hypothetical protein
VRFAESDSRILNLDEFFRTCRRVDWGRVGAAEASPFQHPRAREEPAMNDETSASEEGIPVMQQILDNPFLLLFLGIAVPTVFYIVWGVMEIVTIPVAK